MDEVTVDRQTLKALGADSRIAILKNLARKRMTQAELASELGIAASSVNEHLHHLQSASLIAQIDDGRKWKYYEITQKGRLIVAPSNVKVWFLLSISLLALVASLWQIYPTISTPVPQPLLVRETQASQPAEPLAAQAAAGQDNPQPFAEAISESPSAASEQGQTAQQATAISESAEITSYKPLFNSLPVAETAVFLASLLFLGAAIALLLKKE